MMLTIDQNDRALSACEPHSQPQRSTAPRLYFFSGVDRCPAMISSDLL
jgi:hypothetical protein